MLSVLIIVSDNDMENRYEQMQLVLSTLKHFSYDQEKLEYLLRHAGHCEYKGTELGEIMLEFVNKYR